MQLECWRWATLIVTTRSYLSDDELRDYMHAVAERRILDRFIREGVI